MLGNQKPLPTPGVNTGMSPSGYTSNGCFDCCWGKIQEHEFHGRLLQFPLTCLWPRHLKLLLELRVTSPRCPAATKKTTEAENVKKPLLSSSLCNLLPVLSFSWSNLTGNPPAREQGKITLHTFILHTKKNKGKLEWSWETANKHMEHQIIYLCVNEDFTDVRGMCYKIKTTHY